MFFTIQVCIQSYLTSTDCETMGEGERAILVNMKFQYNKKIGGIMGVYREYNMLF